MNKFIFLLIFLAIIFSFNVSAWSNTTFNNSLGDEILTFANAGSIIRYLSVPQNTFVLSGFMNLTYPISANAVFRGTVAYWKFDETSGTNIRDWALGINNGTLAKAAMLNQQGIIGTAIILNQSNNMMNVTHRSSLNFSNTNLSFSFWINGTIASSNQIVFSKGGTAEFRYAWNDTAAVEKHRFQFGAGGSSYNLNSTLNVVKGTYQHVVITSNSNNMSIYVNGTYAGSTAYTGGFDSTHANWTFQSGGDSGGNPSVNGTYIDEFGVWNRSLSASEVSSLYNNGAARSFVFQNGTGTFNLSIGSTSFQTFTDSYNGSDSSNTTTRTSNLNTYLNNYLSSCTFVSGLCQVPFNFSSTIGGVFVRYNDMSFDNNGFTENSQTFNATSTDLKNESFIINITYDSDYYSGISASLSYNGTVYSGTKVGTGSNVLFTRTISIPGVLSSVNNTFNWIIFLSNSSGTTATNSTNKSQFVTPSQFALCNSSLNVLAVNYTIRDEETNNQILSSTFQSTFTWNLGGASKNVSVNTSLTTYGFCISPNETYNVQANIRLNSSGYNDKVYVLNLERYSNVSQAKNLYLLNNTKGTNVIIQLKDQGLIPLTGYTIKIYRLLQSTGNHILVKEDVTDFFGQITATLVENNVEYRLEFYNPSGTLVKVVNKAIVACYALICTQQFIIGDTTNVFEEFEDIENYDSSLTFNNNTNIFTFSWVDNTGAAPTHRLEIIRYNFNGSTNVYNQTSTSLTNSLSYNVGSTRSSYTASAYRKVGTEEIRLELLNVEVGDLSGTFGLEGLFWSMIISLSMILIGIFYPPAGIVLYLVSVFLLGILDILYINPAIMIAQIVIGVLAIWVFRG